MRGYDTWFLRRSSLLVAEISPTPKPLLQRDRLASLGLSQRGEPGVNRLNDDRSLADGRGHSFH